MSKTDRIASRIAAAYLVSRPHAAAVVGDPKRLLEEFELAVHTLASRADPQKLAAAREALESVHDVNSFNSLSYNDVMGPAYKAYLHVRDLPLAEAGHALFLSILQSYTLPPRLLKQVEMASRAYLKSRAPGLPARGPAKYLAAINVYERTLADARKHVEVARAAIAQGKEHGTEGEGATKVQVGPFTLLNTGGFSPQVMQEVKELIQKASEYARHAGLAQVLYGDVNITNTILSNPRILAFYLPAKDEMFVRANVKATAEMTRTTLHELGHRYESKFLQGGKRALNALYQHVNMQEILRKDEVDPEDKPKPGEKLVEKGVTYSVIRTEYAPRIPGGYKVILSPEDPGVKPGVTVSLSIQGWLDRKRGTRGRNLEDPGHTGFVTTYAKKDASENFAEMFSFYAMGKLPPRLVPLFEQALFGSVH